MVGVECGFDVWVLGDFGIVVVGCCCVEVDGLVGGGEVVFYFVCIYCWDFVFLGLLVWWGDYVVENGVVVFVNCVD